MKEKRKKQYLFCVYMLNKKRILFEKQKIYIKTLKIIAKLLKKLEKCDIICNRWKIV